jgi:drug/metabolite transporter (DMT)-like permease
MNTRPGKTMDAPSSSRSELATVGPWLVALGSLLWGTDTYFRISLGRIFASDVVAFYLHAILAAISLPWLIWHRRELGAISRRAWGFVLFTGVVSSGLADILMTEALKHGNQTLVNAVSAAQPLFSTLLARVVHRDRLARASYPWAAAAFVATLLLPFSQLPGLLPQGGLAHGLSLQGSQGVLLGLLVAMLWGMATVASRGVMQEISLPLALALRLQFALLGVGTVLCVRGGMAARTLWPQAAVGHVKWTALMFILFALGSFGLPLSLYYAGLRSTRATTAGYLEQLYVPTAMLISWAYFGQALNGFQVAMVLILVCAIAMVQRAQAHLDRAPAANEIATYLPDPAVER